MDLGTVIVLVLTALDIVFLAFVGKEFPSERG
jgi:hypothetical protein